MILPLLAEIQYTYCTACAPLVHEQITQARSKRRTAKLLADPSPIAALLPDMPASATEEERMSYRIAKNVMERSAATGPIYSVHWALAMLADESGYVVGRPRWEIAHFARCDPKTVSDSVKWLEEHHQITTWREHGHVNRYQLGTDYLIDHETTEELGGKA